MLNHVVEDFVCTVVYMYLQLHVQDFCRGGAKATTTDLMGGGEGKDYSSILVLL